MAAIHTHQLQDYKGQTLYKVSKRAVSSMARNYWAEYFTTYDEAYKNYQESYGQHSHGVSSTAFPPAATLIK